MNLLKIFLVIVLFAAAFTGCKSPEEKRKELIETLPTVKTGDVFSIKEDNHYTLYRVKNVTPDNITFCGSKKQVDAPGELSKIDETGDDDFYVDENIVLTRDEIKNKINNDHIFYINKH